MPGVYILPQASCKQTSQTGSQDVHRFHQNPSGISSGPGATSREAILFVASNSSSSVTSITSFHSTVQVEDGHASPTSLSSFRGNNVGKQNRVYTGGQWGAQERNLFITIR